MTWHAQLNCQRSTPPDGKSGPLNRGGSNDDRTSSSPNRSVGIYPTGQLLRLRLHLAFVKSFSEFFFCGPSAARLEGLWSAGRRCSQLRHDHPGHNPERADAPLHRPTAVWGCAVVLFRATTAAFGRCRLYTRNNRSCSCCFWRGAQRRGICFCGRE